MPRPRLHATNADRQRAYRDRCRLQTHAPGATCRVLGPCTLYHADCLQLLPLLPRTAAVITDPPYPAGAAGYDVTRARRRASQWTHNFVGHDQPFDPSPWLQFAEVLLFGADHYRDRLPARGTWHYWDKLAGTTPADFAPGEWIWSSMSLSPRVFVSLSRGGMRAGEENISRLQQKHHPVQKPVYVMQECLTLVSPDLLVIDPYMGSGSTLVACVRAGRACIGIERDPEYFATSCSRVQAQLQQLTLAGLVQARAQGAQG